MRRVRTALLSVPFLVLGLALAAAPLPGGGPAAAAELDQDDALAAMKSGKIVPLTRIMAQVEANFRGQVIAVRLAERGEVDGALVYEIKLLTPQGYRIELLFDARRGDMIGIGGRGIGAAGEAK